MNSAPLSTPTCSCMNIELCLAYRDARQGWLWLQAGPAQELATAQELALELALALALAL